jgi:biopolymer transport protein ExbB
MLGLMIRTTNHPRALGAVLGALWLATVAPGLASAQSAAAPAVETAPMQADGAIVPLLDPLADPEGLLAAETAMLPRDLSPWGMFMQADWVVKAVMIGLAFASVVTWTIWLAKSLELAAAQRRTRLVLRTLQSAGSLEDALGANARQRGAAAALVQAADHELTLSSGLDTPGIKERIESVFERILHAGARQAGRGTGLLATIGATAPFVGLFGTVWGIMNSFIGISKAQTTNLAVVAPGIAEALLATAIGLAAAIPAVVIYNHFTRQIAAYRALLGDAAAGIQQLVSRDLDRRRMQAHEHRREAAE